MPDQQNRLVFTQESNFKGIAEAIRKKRLSEAKFKPPQMKDAIMAIRLGIPMVVQTGAVGGGEPARWVRPSAWPNIEAIPIDREHDEEVCYMTFDNTRATISQSAAWAGFSVRLDRAGATCVFERGHLDNGVFVVDSTFESDEQPANLSTVVYVTDYYGTSDNDYVVYRVRPSDEAHLVRLCFAYVPKSISLLPQDIPDYCMACLERVGNLPYVNDMSLITNRSRYGCASIQHDRNDIGKYNAVTTLVYAWQNCYSLQSLDIGGWDTSNWAVTNLGGAWQNCNSLQSLDIGGWDTSSWAVTTLGYAWSRCYSLQSLDIGGWDTSSWAVTNLGNAWQNCYSLQSLDIGNLSLSGVTSTANTMQYCRKLKDISSLNGLKTSISLASCVMLSRESVLNIFASLGTVSNDTITLYVDTYNKLSADDIAVATTKGWTVASAA